MSTTKVSRSLTGAATDDMTWLPGGTFVMGSERFYPEEAPSRRVAVDGFWIDTVPVTNRQFAAFIDATGYTTVAQVAPDPRNYPGMQPDMARPGSLVFHKTATPVDTSNPTNWWRYEFGADWRRPLGPDSDLDTLDLWDHPVVHIAYADAIAYAQWSGKDLPTEAEWEYAAWGGAEDQDYAWGNVLAPGGAMMANYWQGLFPFANQMLDGWERSSPVGSYAPNGYGLYDMIGNTWEWTRDWWSEKHQAPRNKKPDSGCDVRNAGGARLKESFDPGQPGVRIGRKVLKGGSHLCAPN